MLNRKKFYETCPDESEETETESPVMECESATFETEYGGGLKCMMNGVIYYTGAKNAVEAEARREMRAALWATKMVEDDFDDEGRARVKIVYVDDGPLSSSYNAYIAHKHIKAIVNAEKDKEKKEGRPGPRLIFVKQHREYWPGSDDDNDPDSVIARRRADKERSLRKPYVDRRDFYVPPLPEEEEADNKPLPFFAADSKARWDYHYEAERRYFMRYFDPSLPGTKFIIENLSPSDVSSFIVECRKDYPDIWKELRHLVPQKAGKPALNRSSEETADMCHHKLI